MTSHTIIPTVFTKSSLYSINISIAIFVNDIELFKNLLNLEDDSLSEDQRYAIAYNSCLNAQNKKFLEYLIFDLHLKENLIASQYITEEVKALFIQRKAEELSKELGINDTKDKGMKV